MRKVFSGSAVPRHLVFILNDGSFIVQWDETRVQELISGRYRQYTPQDFGHAITDYELNQLKAAGRVEHFNKYYVWLFALPEQNRVSLLNLRDIHIERVRTFYLNTRLAKHEQPRVEQTLRDLGLDNDYLVRVRADLVVVLGKNGIPFHYLLEAERVQRQLQTLAPTIFEHSVIGFVESALDNRDAKFFTEPLESELGTAEKQIATPAELASIAGKSVVLAVDQEHERQAFLELLNELRLRTYIAESGAEALLLIEDQQPDLLLIDLRLHDLHSWRVIQKVKEIGGLRHPAMLVVADHTSSADELTFALTVVKVDVFLVKPLSMARLRHHIWSVLKTRN